MPWIVPSHQAPAVALKAWKPGAFSGLGLVLGTMAPDLAAILRFDNNSPLAHSLAGQVYITMPMVVALHAVATRLVFPWLLVRVAEAGRSVFAAEALASRPARTAGEWVRVAYSGFLGGLTHFWIDGFTHGGAEGWARNFLPVLSRPVCLPMGSMPLHDVLQWSLTLVLGVVALWMWRGLAERVPSSATKLPRRDEQPIAASGLVRGLVLAALLGALAAVLLRPDAGLALRAELAVYGALAGPLYAVLFAALIDQLSEGSSQRSPDIPLGGDSAAGAA